MTLRILGTLIGLACVALPFGYGIDTRSLASLVVGVAFIAYGIGGQKLLAKVVPRYAETAEQRESGDPRSSK